MAENVSKLLKQTDPSVAGWEVGAREGGAMPGWVRSSGKRALIDPLTGRVPGSLPVLSSLMPMSNLVRRW